MLSLLSTSILRFLSADLLSSHLSPSICPYLALCCPRCNTRHFPLSSFMLLTITQCSSLPRSLCDASRPSRESTASPGLVSSAGLMYSTPASRKLIKMLSRNGPKIEPWRTLLGTSHQPDVAPLTTTLSHSIM